MLDTLIYDSQGNAVPCSEVIKERGGWENLSASEASLLSSLGCVPESLSAGYETPYPEEEVPRWTSSVPTTGVNDMNFGAVLSQIDQSLIASQGQPISTGPLWTGFQAGPLIKEGLKALGQGALQELGGEAVQQLMQTPQYQLGVTPGAACWGTGKINRRMRVKLQRLPDGSVQVVRYCAPRRMNPCNARALGRAARRLGAFQALSSRVEKVIARAIKSKSRPRRAAYCGPKKGCR